MSQNSSSSSRRTFLKAATLASAGFMVAQGNTQSRAQEESKSPNERLNVACIGVGGKGDSDANHAAAFGNIVAICDTDRNILRGKGEGGQFRQAKQYTDFREMLTAHENEIDIVTVSTPDHTHTAAALMAMRMGKHCFTQKPLTRTIYEARKMSEVAKEMGVCTQMGNHGTAMDESRKAIAQLKAGVIGKITAAYSWSNRPVWAQAPDRWKNMRRFAEEARERAGKGPEAEKMIWERYNQIQQDLTNLDWRNWIGPAPYRDYYPGLYHNFQWRGWWDFGSGALGDMACHHLTVPFAACGLKDPTWVRARTTGHDFDSFPDSSIIEFEFPETADRGKIPFWWYDKQGNRPPMEIFEPYGITRLGRFGVFIVGEKGAFYSAREYCEDFSLLSKGGGTIEPLKNVDVVLAEKRGGADETNMYELFRAVKANDPSICVSNFVDRAGPLTETILLGNLAVWAASKGDGKGKMGDWGEKVEWDAKNLQVTNLADLNDLAGKADHDFTVAGMVTGVQNLVSQKGKPYGRIRIEDYDGNTHEFTMFDKDYEKWRIFFYTDYFLFIRGKITPRFGREGELEARVGSVMQLDDVEKSMLKEICVTVPLEVVDGAFVASLDGAARASEGGLRLALKVTDRKGGVSVKMHSRSRKVALSGGLMDFLDDNELRYSIQ